NALNTPIPIAMKERDITRWVVVKSPSFSFPSSPRWRLNALAHLRHTSESTIFTLPSLTQNHYCLSSSASLSLFLAHVKPKAQEHQSDDQIQNTNEYTTQRGKVEPIGHPRAKLSADENSRNDKKQHAREPLIIVSENQEKWRCESDQ